MDDTIKITGTIVEIIYSNSDNGYTVCDIDSVEEGLFTATGYMPYVSEGENVSISGIWSTHPDYGDQFKISYYETIMPTDEDAIINYLSTGVISGIRESTAKKLVERFGIETLNIMLTDPIRLSEVKGISKNKAQKIGESFAELQTMQSIIIFLQQYNISANMAMRIHQVLGVNAIERIKENPYILSELVDGISFKTSDNIAFTRGYPKNGDSRIKSGLKYVLKQAAFSNGHTYMPKSLLIEHTVYTLDISENDVENGLSALALDKNVSFDKVNNEDVCYLSSMYKSELYIARRINSMTKYEHKFTMTEEEILSNIASIEKENNITLAAEQKNAVLSAVTCGCMVLTGGPGTGKTTTIKTIIELMQDLNLKIALAAPTGRAAKRMSEVTGLEAKTIHRLLGTRPGENNLSSFQHDENDPLDADVIIVDEMSMVDLLLMNSFLKAVKIGARFIMAGDADQLPSVGAGNVLHDIIESGIVPIIKLDHIFRQAEESLIVVNAHKINKGELPEITDKSNDFFFLRRHNIESVATTIVDLYRNRLPKSYDINPFSQIQVLSPMKKGVAGVINLNREIQKHLNPPSVLKQEYVYGNITFRVGDKVMQVKNNYDIEWTRNNGECGTGIYNGDMGIISDISSRDKQMIIIFDDDKEVEYLFNNLDELDLAYAITVHKSQGSEFPFVIMPVCNYSPMLMCRNLFYTAVTRAKDMVILVGSEKIISNMVHNNTEKERFTGLSEKLIIVKDIIESDPFN